MIARTHSRIEVRVSIDARVLAALSAILIAALLAACGTPSTGTADPELRPSGEDSPLTDMEWVLTELRGEPPLGGAHLTLVVRAISATYEGDLKEGEISGTWMQGPSKLPLVFKRGAALQP